VGAVGVDPVEVVEPILVCVAPRSPARTPAGYRSTGSCPTRGRAAGLSGGLWPWWVPRVRIRRIARVRSGYRLPRRGVLRKRRTAAAGDGRCVFGAAGAEGGGAHLPVIGGGGFGGTAAAMSMECTTSANSTVTCLYSAGFEAAETAVPHSSQNFALDRSSAPHDLPLNLRRSCRRRGYCRTAVISIAHVNIVSPLASQDVPNRRCDPASG
jgi:hypothetical protein